MEAATTATRPGQEQGHPVYRDLSPLNLSMVGPDRTYNPMTDQSMDLSLIPLTTARASSEDNFFPPVFDQRFTTDRPRRHDLPFLYLATLRGPRFVPDPVDTSISPSGAAGRS